MSSPNSDTPAKEDNHNRHQSHHSNLNRKNKNKRKYSAPRDQFDGMGDTLSFLRQADIPEFNLIGRPDSRGSGSKDEEEGSSQDWQTIENGRPKKKAKKIPKKDSGSYPEITFSKDARLRSQIKLSDLQGLVLYILADGTSPQFVSVRHRSQIRKVVLLMVPGLERHMFEATDGGLEKPSHKEGHPSYTSPDDYYPMKIKEEKLSSSLKRFADMFEYLWPVKTPGDEKYGKMHSPLQAMLTAPNPKSKEEKNFKKNGKGVQQAKEPIGWQNKRTPITEFILTPEELLENDYTVHPAAYDSELLKTALEEHRKTTGVSKEHGWVDTLVNSFEDGSVPDNEVESGSLTAGREILAIDCEMCKTGETEFSLTRISIVGWDGSVIMDELVKPDRPIINYLTMYSGITEKMLENVTTTLADIQKKLSKILHPRAVLIGHSLNSDLTALKLTHPFIIDTAVAYPHPRGPPLKSALKFLAKKYLNREIQKGHGTTGPGAGHDSIEDARTCLDLMKQKCEKGAEWGTSDAVGENLFKKISRSGITYKAQGGSAVDTGGKSSAVVDWGDPKRGAGGAATHVIGCKNDNEVVEGVVRAVKGDSDGKEIPGGGVDFVWGRLRELEALKGWWNNNKIAAADAAAGEIAAVADVPIEMTSNFVSEAKQDDDAHTLATTAVAEAAPEIEKAEASSEGLDILQTLENSISAAVPTEPAPTPAALASNALPPPPPSSTSLSTATATLTAQLAQIYDALPPCTAFIVYSGSGDPREMSRLQAMQAQFKREYKIKKWDHLSVKWTDTEEQALKRAAKEAREGIAFMCVK